MDPGFEARSAMRNFASIGLIGLSLSVSLQVHAQAGQNRPQADMSAQADEQFRRGREAQNRGDCQKALEYFRESHALKPGRGTLLNMGLCEKKLGQLARALQHLEEVLPQLPPGDDRRAIVRENLAELKPRVPWLRIVLTANAPAGTLVTYDDTELEPTMIGTDIPVDPGKHVVVVEAKGLPNRRYEVMMEEGKRQTLRVEPGGVAAEPAAESDDGSRKTKFVVGFVVGGVGLAGIVAGAVTGSVALQNHSETEKMCPTHRGCSAEVARLAEQGQTLSVMSTVAFGLGIVGIGVGVPLAVLNRKAKEKPPTVSLHVLPQGPGIGLLGTF